MLITLSEKLTQDDIIAVSPQSKSEGSWDSIHVFEAIDSGRPTHHYKLTSTVILQLGAASEALGTLNLSGNLTRQVETDMTVKDDTTHVANVGRVSLLVVRSSQSGSSSNPAACRGYGVEDAESPA